MCAIERHPDSGTRDSLTHTLFNLIKRPDGQQRQIIMDVSVCFCFLLEFYRFLSPSSMIMVLKKNVTRVALSFFQACVNLAKNVGEMRTETELLPQCWEQVKFCLKLDFCTFPLYL